MLSVVQTANPHYKLNKNRPVISPKIHVLESGKKNWDVIRDVAHSGIQEDAFYILDLGDIIRKHKEWILSMPRVTPFYGKLLHLIPCDKY